jgi:hypothetical protein
LRKKKSTAKEKRGYLLEYNRDIAMLKKQKKIAIAVVIGVKRDVERTIKCSRDNLDASGKKICER